MHFLPSSNQVQASILTYFLPAYFPPMCEPTRVLCSWGNQVCLQRWKQSAVILHKQLPAFQNVVCPWAKWVLPLRGGFLFYRSLKHSPLNLKHVSQHRDKVEPMIPPFQLPTADWRGAESWQTHLEGIDRHQWGDRSSPFIACSFLGMPSKELSRPMGRRNQRTLFFSPCFVHSVFEYLRFIGYGPVL